jgi:hypothetical protein
MQQEDLGAISANTRVAVGQLIITMRQVAMQQPSRCIAYNVAQAHYQDQAVEAALLISDEQGSQLREVLPTLPTSLRDGEQCRVMWREQTIALSLHQELDAELTFLQSLTAMSRWIMEHPDLYKLTAAHEARTAVTIIDPISIAQLLQQEGEKPQ